MLPPKEKKSYNNIFDRTELRLWTQISKELKKTVGFDNKRTRWSRTLYWSMYNRCFFWHRGRYC